MTIMITVMKNNKDSKSINSNSSNNDNNKNVLVMIIVIEVMIEVMFDSLKLFLNKLSIIMSKRSCSV